MPASTPLATLGDVFPPELATTNTPGTPVVPAPASPRAQASASPPSPPVSLELEDDQSGPSLVAPPPSRGGSNTRQVILPRWVLVCVLWLVGLSIVYGALYVYNYNQPFVISDSLDHRGPFYRQAALAPIDAVRSRAFDIRADWIGRKYVIYTVGPRKFVQIASGEAAIEILDKK